MLRPQERAFTASICLLFLQAVFLAACGVSYNINPLGYGYVYDQMASPTSRTVVIPTVAVTKSPDVLLKQGGLGNTLDTFLAKYTLLTISRPPTLYAFQQTLDAWPGGSILFVSLESGVQDQAPRAMQFSLVPGTNHPTTYEQAEAFVQGLLPGDLTGPTTIRVLDKNKGKCSIMVWHSTDLSKVFPPADFLSEGSGKFATQQKPASGSTPQPGCPAPQQALARTMIREARFRLNQFRDDRWEKLIRVRLLMKKMTFWTGLVLYALLVFAILLRTNAAILGLLAVYYLIGAAVGLFGRLYAQSKVDVSLDNYRLADARLLALPLYSGLAAILGISLFSFLPALSDLGGNTTAESYGLDFASQFVFSPQHVLIASIFGLAPNLFTSAIQAQVDRYAGDIKSTSVQAKKEQ